MSVVLFTRKDSVYKELGADCWDVDRDARLYLGPGKVIAHPPCRAWGRYAHWSKHSEAEKQLAPWTINLIRCYGGVMEHPVTSRVWDFLLPTDKSIVVDQVWWGHSARKRTRLFYNQVGSPPPLPFTFGEDTPTPTRPVEYMSKAQRERTPPEFARWLLDWVY
jgi:hypothetical protein